MKASLGGGGAAAAVPGPGSSPSSPASRKRSRNEDEATSNKSMAMAMARRESGVAGLPAPLRALAETYDRICFIFSIHANQERRSFRDLRQTFHQLSGGEVEIDDLRRMKAAYPNCLAFSYKGLPSKPLDLDLMVQIPRAVSLDGHKRNLRAGLAEAAKACAEGSSAAEDVPLADLPERPLNRSLEASEKYVKRVIQSYSPKRAKHQRSSSSPSSSKIKSFFQTNKIISGRALTMVERTHDKTRKLFDEGEKEARNCRRNLAQLPQVFDRVRGLFRSLGRRAMPMRDMVPHLMSMRKDKAVQQSEIEAQVDLIVAHAPEWCTVQCDTRKNRILSLNPGADPNQVRRKLNLLSQSQD